MKWIFTTILIIHSTLIFSQQSVDRTVETTDAKMQWFADAKLGIFIHWGIYAVNGIDESWSFHNGLISYPDYMKQLKGFTAANYNPQEWADLIKESGARYAVLTSKHHDGVALYDSKQGGINVLKDTPAKRDLLKPFTDALRKDNLKVGLYFSLIDWSYPDYDGFTKTEKRYEKDSLRFAKFLKYCHGQLKEISENYNPDLFWFDGDWEHSAEEWQAAKIRSMLLTKNPDAIFNSRLQGYGDYATPEQGVPVFKPKSKYWELCLTTNDNWGYQQRDTNYKTPFQVINIFVDCISKGGNLLLDIGPKADGTIPIEQVNILKALGHWTTKYSEAIYSTHAGIPLEFCNYPSTLSPDSNTIYLFLNAKPNGPVAIKGIRNKIKNIHTLGANTNLKSVINGKLWWSEVPGILYIDVPANLFDEQVIVIAVELDGKVDLFANDK